MITIDCHRKIVSENGMTPVIGSRRLGQARRRSPAAAPPRRTGPSPRSRRARDRPPPPRPDSPCAARARSRQRAHQQAAEDQAQAPVEQRGQHADGRDKADRAAAGGRACAASRSDQPLRRRRGRDDIAADRDESHLHGEGDQAPEAVAEGLADRQRGAPLASAASATTTTAIATKMKASGNQRSAQAVNAMAMRTRTPSRCVVSGGDAAFASLACAIGLSQSGSRGEPCIRLLNHWIFIKIRPSCLIVRDAA